jgi:hypothetical protein
MEEGRYNLGLLISTALEVDRSKITSFNPKAAYMRISASRAPNLTSSDFPLPPTGFRIVAWKDKSVAEKTWIWSAFATRSRVEEGAQARIEIGPEKSPGSFTEWTVCSDRTERITILDEERVAMKLPLGLALQCGEAVGRAC